MVEALLECREYLAADTLILRAFHHRETSIVKDPPVALDVLGNEIARRFGCLYAPEWLGKHRSTAQLRRLRQRSLRDGELSGAYYWKGPPLPADPAVPAVPADPADPLVAQVPRFRYLWIIDDILTTGSTIGAILQTVMPVMGTAQPFALTLGKTSVDTTINHKLALSTDYGTWMAGRGWQIHE
jgi:hypothetical protein